jgi:hypothetical protein
VILNIEKEVECLQRMTVGELQARFAVVFGEQPRGRHRQWLIRRIAWRVQANAEGDLSERARQRALELADDANLRATAPRGTAHYPVTPKPLINASGAAVDGRLPIPGTQLTRKYKGQTLVVTVRTDGFEFQNQILPSLSAVAKLATGSHWNGFHFFGLMKREAPR